MPLTKFFLKLISEMVDNKYGFWAQDNARNKLTSDPYLSNVVTAATVITPPKMIHLLLPNGHLASGYTVEVEIAVRTQNLGSGYEARELRSLRSLTC